MNRALIEREVIVRLFQVSNALQTFLDKLLKENKLTAKQFFMMIILGSFDYDPKISELAKRFGTSHQNVKQVVLKLEKANYVKLYKDTSDSRVTRVQFTAYANEFWASRNNTDDLIISDIFSSLTEETLTHFRSGLLQTIDNIEGLKY